MLKHHSHNNVVESIRAHTVDSLRKDAAQLEHRFLYVNLSQVSSIEEATVAIIQQLGLPKDTEPSLSKVGHHITDVLYKSGLQSGFIVVLDRIAISPSLDKDTIENLLDVFRDAADYWAEHKVSFQCFFSHAIACFTPTNQKKTKAKNTNTCGITNISSMAFCMSSPFNAGYWLSLAQEKANTVGNGVQ